MSLFNPQALKLPKSKSNRLKENVPVISADDSVDVHDIEKKMIDDVGLFRHKNPTVDDLLRDRQKMNAVAQPVSNYAPPVGATFLKPESFTTTNRNQQQNIKDMPGTVNLNLNEDNMSLITALTKKLTAVERLCSQQKSALIQKDDMLHNLTLKYNALEKVNEAHLRQINTILSMSNMNATNTSKDDTKDKVTSTNTSKDVFVLPDKSVADSIYHLTKQTEGLRHQVHEMETFLSDYGLVWVGYRALDDVADDGDVIESGIASRKNSKATSTTESNEAEIKTTNTRGSIDASSNEVLIYFNMERFKACIRDLNNLAGQGNMKIIKNEQNMHTFQPPASMSIVVYQNGLFINNGPLRRFNAKDTQTFITDVLDGYFPYEFKDTYPDGLIFNVNDQSTIMYNKNGSIVADSTAVFKKEGYRLGGNTGKIDVQPVKGVPYVSSALSIPSISSVNGSISSGPNQPQTTSQFLNQLPERVIANGNVVNVREDIAQKLNASSKNTNVVGIDSVNQQFVLVDTPALRLIQSNSTKQSGRPATPMDIATLRVKGDDGMPTLILKLRFHDTIAAVHQYVKEYRKDRKTKFELRTSFPNRVYTAMNQSLAEAGLVPNAMLLTRTLKSDITS